jgi:hypothetical protein
MIARFAQKIRLQRVLNFRTIVVVASVLLTLWFGCVFAFGMEQQTAFLPGTTSDEHFLFETSCKSCHDGFKPISNETCLRCHEAEMAEDKHGPNKFRDPRWAGDLEKIEVLTCTTCHNEHVQMVGRGVHLPADFCMACHLGIIQGDMQSHEGFAPDGCWTAGCHNFHDHRSISTGFLYDNLDQPPMLPVQAVPELTVLAELEEAPDPDLRQEFLGGAS